MTHVKGRKHPADVAPAQAAVIKIVDKVLVVIPIDEVILQNGTENQRGDHGNENRREPVGILESFFWFCRGGASVGRFPQPRFFRPFY